MGERLIPARKVYTCDICNKEHDRPAYDPRLTYHKDGLDYSGYAVGDATEKWLLCASCDKAFSKLFHNWIREVRNQNEH